MANPLLQSRGKLAVGIKVGITFISQLTKSARNKGWSQLGTKRWSTQVQYGVCECKLTQSILFRPETNVEILTSCGANM